MAQIRSLYALATVTHPSFASDLTTCPDLARYEKQFWTANHPAASANQNAATDFSKKQTSGHHVVLTTDSIATEQWRLQHWTQALMS